MAVDLKIFKDYDIRGVYPSQLNGQAAGEIAHAIVRYFNPKTIAIGRDMRLSGPEIQDAMMKVFTTLGVQVFDAGLIGTEVSYYIGATQPYDIVIMLSASHNPPEYNGMKITKKGPISITSDSGLYAIRDLIAQGPLPDAATPGTIQAIDIFDPWREKIHSLVHPENFKPLKVIADAGNGMAGKLLPLGLKGLPINLTPLYFELDGSFPNHVPNPLIEKNTADLRKKVVEEKADIGFAFDGDADRTFLIDDKGRMVSGTIMTALMATYFLKRNPGDLILYNAICGRIVPEIVEKLGGKSKRVRVGHSYIKEYMNETGAVYAGEHSGHYYYRDFFKAESGVLTALIILELLSLEDKPLSTLVDELNVYPASGELNFTSEDIPTIMTKVKEHHTDAKSIDELDGMSIWYENYWFNIRASKTEPLLRLNIEADTQEILDTQKKALIDEITSLGGTLKE